MKKRNILIIAFSFLGLCLIAIGALTLNLFKSDEQPGNLIVNTDEGNENIRLTGVKRKITANNTEVVTITATVNPAKVVDKTLNWTIAWNGGGQTVAVTNYVGMTVSEDTMSVNIEFIDLFTNQIKVTATSNLDPSVSASCTLDCYVKTTDITEAVIYFSNSDSVVESEYDNTDHYYYITLPNMTWNSLKDGSYVINVDSYMTVKKGTVHGSHDNEPRITLSTSAELEELLGIEDYTTTYQLYCKNVSLGWTLNMSEILNDAELLKLASQTDYWMDMTLTFNDYDSDGNIINTCSRTFKIKGFNVEDGLTINSVTLNDTEVIFK